MAILFISDIHLTETQPNITEIFLHFLKTQAQQAEALYILGDLFEAWLGDDISSPFYSSIITALKHLTQSGVPVYLMHGNRDFLIGKTFFKATGCQYLKDPSIINLYGTPTLLMHGDLLCTQDVSYQRFRKVIRHPLVKQFFLSLPLSLRKKIGSTLRKKSQVYTSTSSLNIMDVTPGVAEQQLQFHQATLLIHGHTHRPAIHTLENNLVRIVLAAWHEEGSVLICEKSPKGQLQHHVNKVAI
jgi:UDP-2,3-diacylglucosamine hydrolase